MRNIKYIKPNPSQLKKRVNTNRMTTLEGNKLIAEFMNTSVSVTIERGDQEYMVSQNVSQVIDWSKVFLLYHKSLDWLMPVVEKILELGAYYKLRNSWGSRSDRELVYIIEITMYDIDGHEVIYEKQSHDYEQIDSVYSAVIQFLTWYNQQGTKINR